MLSENASTFTVPEGCNYISINAAYYSEEAFIVEAYYGSTSNYAFGLVRMPVTPGDVIDFSNPGTVVTASNYNNYVNSEGLVIDTNYYYIAYLMYVPLYGTTVAGVMEVENLPTVVPRYNADNSKYVTIYKVYFDDNTSSIPYYDSDFKTRYEAATGNSL